MKIRFDIKRRDTIGVLLATLAFSPIYQIMFIVFFTVQSAIEAPWQDIQMHPVFLAEIPLDVLFRLLLVGLFGLGYSIVFSVLRPLMSKIRVTYEEYEVGEEGLFYSTNVERIVRPWKTIHKPKSILGGVFLRYDTMAGSSLIPSRAFKDPEQQKAFIKEVMAHAEA